MADEETQEEQAAPAPKKPGLFENKMVVIAIILVVQAGMAFAAAQFIIKPAAMSGNEEAAAEEEKEKDEGEEKPQGIIVSLEEMVVSLNSEGRTRYLRTNIALEASDSKVAAAIEERMPEFRDAAILRLSSYSPDELGPFEGKEAAKAEIKKVLKDLISEGELLSIYFSDFVVQ